MYMAVRRKADFAKVTEENLAIFIARRKTVNFAAGVKEKTGPMYGSKDKNEFCSSKKEVDFAALQRKNGQYL